MLRAAWRSLGSVRAHAVAQAPVSALRGGGSASLALARCGLQPPSEPPGRGALGLGEDGGHQAPGERQWQDEKQRVVARKGVTKWERGN